MDIRIEPELQVGPVVYLPDEPDTDREAVRQTSERLLFQIGAILIVCAAAIAGWIAWFVLGPVTP